MLARINAQNFQAAFCFMVRFALSHSDSKDTEKVVWENGKLVPATSAGQKQKAFEVVFAENLAIARYLIPGNHTRFVGCFNGLSFPLNFFETILERKIDDSKADYFCRLFLVDDYVEIPIDENTDILIVDSSKNCLVLVFYFYRFYSELALLPAIPVQFVVSEEKEHQNIHSRC